MPTRESYIAECVNDFGHDAEEAGRHWDRMQEPGYQADFERFMSF